VTCQRTKIEDFWQKAQKYSREIWKYAIIIVPLQPLSTENQSAEASGI